MTRRAEMVHFPAICNRSPLMLDAASKNGVAPVSKQRSRSPASKARDAMETSIGHKRIQEIAADHAIQRINVNQWERQLLDGAT